MGDGEAGKKLHRCAEEIKRKGMKGGGKEAFSRALLWGTAPHQALEMDGVNKKHLSELETWAVQLLISSHLLPKTPVVLLC